MNRCAYVQWDGSVCGDDGTRPYGLLLPEGFKVARLCQEHAGAWAQAGALWLGNAHLGEEEAIVWEVMGR